MGKFILNNLDSDPITGEPRNKLLADKSKPWLGHWLVGYPAIERHISLDFTGPPGASTGIYYSLMFQLGKWEYIVAKFDESIEVSPVHAQYYQLTHKQKEELETRIKSGLASVSQSVADYELLLHDLRKYTEMLHYLGYPDKDGVPDLSVGEKEREKKTDNHALRSVFIDQVDIHTGEGISMRSIVSRWPTLISDFQKLDDSDMEVDKTKKKLDISRAEAVILVTKNKLYQEWKKLFLPVVSDRYRRIRTLADSREKSVKEYKEWLKPIVARHRLISEGLSAEGGRSGKLASFITGTGHAVSSSEIVIWVWKDYTPPDIYKIPHELIVRKNINLLDDWTKRNLIFDKEHGLITDYPWITEKWCEDRLKELQNPTTGILPWMPPHKMYYSFLQIKFNRTNMRSATGEEIEDGIFDLTFIMLSANAMLAKLLELKAKQEEFNKYVDELLGIPRKTEGTAWEDRKKSASPLGNIMDKFSLPMSFIKRGPYDRDFDERVTKYIIAPGAAGRYVPVINFIKQKMGYGQ